MDEKLQKRLVGMVESMPAFPQSVQKILELCSDMDCAPKDLVKVVEHDPVMTVKMLKMVNSAFFGLRNNIISINHALVYLGLNTVKNMALGIATVGMLKKFDYPRFNSSDFLLHSLLVAAVARKIGEIMPQDEHDATDFFIAGLLHDFGKIVLFQFMRDEFCRALDLAHSAGTSLKDAEVEIVGVDHSEVGAMLGEYWTLPVELIACIREHHYLQGDLSLLTDCVVGANQAVKHLEIGYSGNPVSGFLSERTQQRLGMSFDELIINLGDLSEDVQKARIFMQL